MAVATVSLELVSFEVNESGVQAMVRSSQAMAHWDFVGREVAQTAAEHAPFLTGTLSRSIHHVVTAGGPEGVEIRVGSEVPYAHLQEMSNRTHRGFLRGALGRVGPHSIEGQA